MTTITFSIPAWLVEDVVVNFTLPFWLAALLTVWLLFVFIVAVIDSRKVFWQRIEISLYQDRNKQLRSQLKDLETALETANKKQEL